MDATAGAVQRGRHMSEWFDKFLEIVMALLLLIVIALAVLVAVWGWVMVVRWIGGGQ